MSMVPMAVQKVLRIDSLHPADYNPRVELRPGDPEFEKIRRSIERFGFADPVVVNSDGTIIGGHQRIAVAKELGYIEVPCSVVDLNKDDERALNVALNKITGAWDEEKLAVLLQGLSLGGYDVTLTGYSQEESDELINGLTLDRDVQEDGFDPEPAYDAAAAKPYVKRGDVFQLGEHRLMCGDSTSLEDIEVLLDGHLAQCVITDPPYNMNYEGAGNTASWKRAQNKILNDHMSDAEFNTFLCSVYKAIASGMVDGASFYVFYKELGQGVFITALRGTGLTFKQELVWVKNQIVLGGSKYQNMYEPCLFGCKGQQVKFWYGKRKQRSVIESIDLMGEDELRDVIHELMDEEPGDVVRENKQIANTLHPTMKPVRLLGKFIKNSTKAKDIVLDVFGGSGSTMIACEQMDRSCFMMELDPNYCQVIIERWESFTGRKAVIIDH